LFSIFITILDDELWQSDATQREAVFIFGVVGLHLPMALDSPLRELKPR
jgi:hypothetical protein